MRASVLPACVALIVTAAVSACGRSVRTTPPPRPPQTSGTLQVRGLQAPVTIVRDAWGVPHITAANTDDLFFAQGFVQAQDRLFQMDLWKRSVQGHLSEVLGANFIQRDSMTRRIQFRGDLDREWASYGPETRRIATAFTNGINARVREARQDLPEEFALAGWVPEYWRPEDLLNRTDAFLASGNALDDLFRARLLAAVGVRRGAELLQPAQRGAVDVDPAVDLGAITFVVSDAVKRIGTPPFFLFLAGKVAEPRRTSAAGQGAGTPTRTADAAAADLQPRGRTWLVDGGTSGTGAALVGSSVDTAFSVPSRHYLVHLTAPGWNVIGATAPWLPGVLIGHNDRVAWAMTPVPADTEDIFVERLNPANPHQVERDGRWVDMAVDYERVDVKGRERPIEYERQYTVNGVVIAQDKARGLVYTLAWSGTEPGGAGELAALAFNRASSVVEFGEALTRWKMPVAEFAYGDSAGRSGRAVAGLVPRRARGDGSTPVAGWSSDRRWTGFDSSVRTLSSPQTPGTGGFNEVQAQQATVTPPGARTVLQLLNGIGHVPDLPDAVIGRPAGLEQYIRIEQAIRTLLARRSGVPEQLRDELAARLDIARILAQPSPPWFGGNLTRDRYSLLADALSGVGAETTPTAAGGASITFEHPLAVGESARRRLNVGPVDVTGAARSGADRRSGAVFQAIFDAADWNRSAVIIAPGQSGAPASPHYDDLAPRWAEGKYIPLLFDQTTRDVTSSETLVLQPN